MIAAHYPSQGSSARWLMPLNAVLAVVCLVLFLLAIEQRQAVQAWHAVRDGAAPALQWAGDWLGDRTTDIREALDPTPPVAADLVDVLLTGTFVSLDAEVPLVATFDGPRVILGDQTLTTRPLRIAAGADVFAPGQTFAERLDARADAQIELREVVPDSEAEAVAPSALCADAAPSSVALLHRQNTVDLMLFPRASETTSLGEPCVIVTLKAQ
ncbi:MAG: hypothetical protein JHC81_12700 [Brevundimonas sp.]|uniref:hypothetical protein n=1 Tax=Brevundimonas sp. TaxID=1871086 RepID=UPI001A1B6F4B|nr:hypothetical protein [Brevundimonas sp.]MBJ7448385.1 hypothetical protein [Brevundimonas sp.]